MMILVGCEESGVVRDALIAKGHQAVSCDLLPTSSDKDGEHIIGDLIEVINSRNWDMIIAFPPCIYLCSSGLHWNKRRPGRQQKTDAAFDFVMQIANANCEKIAIENPVGCISTRWRKPDQIIQPYQFGEDASKKTCLWLKNIPLLKPTKYFEPRIVDGKKRWSNQLDSGQNRLGWHHNRSQIRSKTYPGIAQAIAEQWT